MYRHRVFVRVAAILAFSAACFIGCMDPGNPIPVPIPIPDPPEPELILGVPSESEVWVTVTIPTKGVEAYVDALLPDKFSYGLAGEAIGPNGQKIEPPVIDVFDHRAIGQSNAKFINETVFNYFDKRDSITGNDVVAFQYFVALGPVALTYNPATKDFQLSLNLDYKIQAVFLEGFVGTFHFREFGYGNNWPFTATISLSSSVKPSSGYGLAMNLSPSVELHDAREKFDVRVVGVYVYNALQEATDELLKAISPPIAELDKRISGFSYRAEAKMAWDAIGGSHSMGGDPPLFVNVDPAKFLAGELHGSEEGQIHIPLGIRGKVSLSDQPSETPDAPLPDTLEVAEGVVPRPFSLNFAIGLTAGYLDHLVSAEAGKPFQIDNATVHLGTVSHRIDEDGLTIKLTGASVEAEGRTYEFDASFATKPDFVEENGRTYIVANLAVKTLKWKTDIFQRLLFGGRLRDEVGEKLSAIGRYDATDLIARVPREVPLGNGLKIEIQEPAFCFGEVAYDPEDQRFRVGCSFSGMATLDLGDVVANLPKPPESRKLGEAYPSASGPPFVSSAAPVSRLSGIEIYYEKNARHLCGIGIEYDGLHIERFGRLAGNTGPIVGRPTPAIPKLRLEPDEKIVIVRVKTNNFVSGVWMTTNKGQEFKIESAGASEAADWQTIFDAEKDGELSGFFGGAGDFLDGLGVMVRP